MDQEQSNDLRAPQGFPGGAFCVSPFGRPTLIPHPAASTPPCCSVVSLGTSGARSSGTTHGLARIKSGLRPWRAIANGVCRQGNNAKDSPMTAAIFDFPTIGKNARLKALDGAPQNVVQPMTVNTAPVEFDPYGMYAGLPASAGTPETDSDPRNPNVVFLDHDVIWIDTAPSDWVWSDYMQAWMYENPRTGVKSFTTIDPYRSPEQDPA